MGYHQAGWDVTGIDISPQPRYPFSFVQADALVYLTEHGHEYDAIHASPPCQRYSRTWRLHSRPHPDLIHNCRASLTSIGKMWVIENVEDAPLLDPVLLCGLMFGIRVRRHRIFEASFPLRSNMPHPQHLALQAPMGRPAREGEMLNLVGNYPQAALAREVMGMPWASRDGIREAVPPPYTRYVGEQMLIQQVKN
jgi:DNA (cytosine-5)-methyltransferase 1